jgi:tetratricopeptide (TPR) repeat protein
VERIRASKPKATRSTRATSAPVEFAAAIGNHAFARLARQQTATADASSRARDLHEQANRFYEQNMFPEALAAWERARELAGLTPDQEAAFLFNIGMCNLRLERFATAVFFFEEYLEKPGANLEVGRERLARARAGAGVAEEGVSERSARSLHERANAAYEAGDFRRALILWERARHQRGATEEHRASFLFNVGMCNLRLERFGSAVAVFEEYLRTPGADQEVGRARLERARAGAGSAEFAEAPLQQPDDAPGQALHRQAERFYDRGMFAEALAVWERARETPGLTPAVQASMLFNVGMCNLRLERFATAVFFFEEYLESASADVEVGRERLARARAGAGVSETGVSERSARSLHERAQQAYEAGDFRRALILWERARHMRGATDELRASFLFNVGMCNLRLERFGSAVAVFEEYLRMPGADQEVGRARLERARAGAGSLTP